MPNQPIADFENDDVIDPFPIAPDFLKKEKVKKSMNIHKIKSLSELNMSIPTIQGEGEIKDLENRIKNSIKLEISDKSVYVTVLAVNKNYNENSPKQIAIHGNPMGGFVYDNSHHCFIYNCVDSYDLGIVPMSVIASIDGVGNNFMIEIPLIEEILIKYMSERQKLELNKFKNKFVKDQFNFIMIQSIGNE